MYVTKKPKLRRRISVFALCVLAITVLLLHTEATALMHLAALIYAVIGSVMLWKIVKYRQERSDYEAHKAEHSEYEKLKRHLIHVTSHLPAMRTLDGDEFYVGIDDSDRHLMARMKKRCISHTIYEEVNFTYDPVSMRNTPTVFDKRYFFFKGDPFVRIGYGGFVASEPTQTVDTTGTWSRIFGFTKRIATSMQFRRRLPAGYDIAALDDLYELRDTLQQARDRR